MLLRYKVLGETIGVQIRSNEFLSYMLEPQSAGRQPIEVFTLTPGGERDHLVFKTLNISNGNKPYFRWNNTNVSLANYIKLTPEAIKKRLDFGNSITDADIALMIWELGSENLLVKDSARKYNRNIIKVGIEIDVQTSEYDQAMYSIVEDNYKVMDMYKIELRRINSDKHESYVYSFESFVNAIRSGFVEIERIR